MKFVAPIILSAAGLMMMANPLAAGETREVKAKDLTLQAPVEWKQQQVSSNMRLAQFEIAPVDGDSESAELVVFPPFGGSVAENVKRWIEQFQSEGREVKMTQGDTEQGKYVLVELSGTYLKPDGPPVLRKTKPVAGQRMVAIMLLSKSGGNYFLKLTGPDQTVADAIDDLRASFGANAEKEEKYELEY